MKNRLLQYAKEQVGKLAQSSLLMELNEKGKQVMQKPQPIVGYEIVKSNGEDTVMFTIDSDINGKVAVYDEFVFIR